MTISFRVQLKISSGHRFRFPPQVQSEIPRFQLPSGASVFVSPKGISNSGDTDLLILSSSGYLDKASACTEARNSLLVTRLAALKMGIGVEFGPGVHESFATGELLDTFVKHNRQIIQDFGGITVYEDQPPAQFVEMWGSVTQRWQISTLLNAVAGISQELPESIHLAAELHSQSLFEASHRAKFLALITAVEVLSTQSMRSVEEREILEGFMTQIANSKLSDIQRQKLASAVGSLRRQSISDAGAAIFTSKLGEAEAKKFRHFYALRSKLTHRSALTEIEREANELKSLVERLLISFL